MGSSQNFLAKLKTVKYWRQDQQEVGMKNHNCGLLEMNFYKERMRKNNGGLFEISLMCEITLKCWKAN